MNVGDILFGKPARLVSVRLDDTVRVAVQRLRAENVGALIVQDVCQTEGNTVVGMLSERDLVRVLAEAGPVVLGKRITDFVTWQRHTCAPGDAIENALDIMLAHNVHYLQVLDGATLIGIVSMRDIATQLASGAGSASSSSRGSIAPAHRASGLPE
ncbi:MAG: CBS domain-containing protein [Terriglobia bacterium]